MLSSKGKPQRKPHFVRVPLTPTHARVVSLVGAVHVEWQQTTHVAGPEFGRLASCLRRARLALGPGWRVLRYGVIPRLMTLASRKAAWGKITITLPPTSTSTAPDRRSH